MKAMLVDNTNTLRWTEVPTPEAGEGEVIVKVDYAAVNRADLMQREGTYPPPEGAPEWMGLEISGTVASIGPGTEGRFPVGSSVCALLGGGGYAEYARVPEGMLMPVPDNVSMAEAAALPEAFATSYLNLFREGGLTSSSTLLMHAGASGLASVVIPMAKAFGCRVITTVLNSEIAASIDHLGADVVVDTSSEGIEDVLKREMEQGHPVDLAIDCLGGENMGKCLPYLKYGAKWIMIATLAGDMSEINLRTVYVKNIRIIGSTLRSKSQEYKAQLLSEMVQKIWDKVSSGIIRPTIHAVLPIANAEDAHQMLYKGKNVGKVVLKVSE